MPRNILSYLLAVEYSVVVVRAGFSALSGTATVTVLVVDVNDNAPRFRHADYHARVAENRRPASDVVARPLATDLDTGRNAVIRFNRAL